MRVIDGKIFTITAITFLSSLVASPSFAGVLCNIGERRILSDVIIADAFSEECLASCATSSNQATYNAPPGWAIVRYWTGTRQDRGRTTRSLSFATAQSHFASASDFSSARSQEASGSAGQYQAGYSAGATQIESLHNAYRASNTTITLTVTAQGRSPYAGSSKREEALNVEELCIGAIDDYRAAIRDELSLIGSQTPANQPRVGYFADGGTTFYADGQKFCGFLSGGHYQMHSFGRDNVPRLGNRSRGEFGSDGGACSIPSGYFAYENATHYSLGNGQYCSFFPGDAYERHSSQRPQEPRFGVLTSDPKGFMTWAGGCP